MPHPLPGLRLLLPTSSPMVAAITSWSVIAFRLGRSFWISSRHNPPGAAGPIRHLRSFFTTFGVSEELSSDGGPELTAGCTEVFLHLWGVRHHMSSAHFPQPNGRAEVAVKLAKHLFMSNTGPTGSLDHDHFLHAMLQLHNSPNPDCNIPSQIIFGCPLRDTLSLVEQLEKFSNPNVNPLWHQAWAAKEEALCSQISCTTESLKEHLGSLWPLVLQLGERVFLQNQQGTSPNKWDRTGIVVESPGRDRYRVKVDGSGCLTLLNCRFLCGYSLATPSLELLPMVLPLLPSTVPTPALPPSLHRRFVESGLPLLTPPPPCRSHTLLHPKHPH